MKIAFLYMNNAPSIGYGAGYVYSGLVNKGYDITFYDSLYYNFDELVENLTRYDTIMVSSMSLMFPQASKIIKRVKEKNEKIVVIVGGVHAICVGANKIWRDCFEADYVCISEGEDFVFPLKDKIINPPLSNLSLLPPFLWKIWNISFILGKNNGFMSITATRGCLFNCSYCCNSVYLERFGSKYIRFRPIKDVLKDVQYLKRYYGSLIKLFYFQDEMILCNRDYAVKLFNAMKEEDVNYGCMIRPELVNEEIVGILKDTGCKYVGMGVECGDEDFRREFLNRFMTNEIIERAFNLFKGTGIKTTSFNMIGYPVEYDDQLTQSTIGFNKEIKPDFAQFSIFYPFEGTKLYDYCKENDLIDEGKQVENYYADSVLKNVSLKETLNNIYVGFK